MSSTAPVVLGRDQFTKEFLAPGRPLLARDAMAGSAWAPPWSLSILARRFGQCRVPLYDTLFSLQGLSTFGGYVAQHTGEGVTGVPPYLRWFARQSADRLPWADAAFEDLEGEWSVPSWLPVSDYILPATMTAVDAARDPFPAKGLFVCGRGGRTRLHVDPWVSDACLCQMTGSKRLIMFPPEAQEMLGDAEGLIDLDAPDERRFPNWRDARPELDEVLQPGDAAFIPAGWLHTAVALEDSVSITWNFVHETASERFDSYLRGGGADDPTVRYFTS